MVTMSARARSPSGDGLSNPLRSEGVSMQEEERVDMATLNVETSYFTHYKTKRLIGRIGRGAEVLPLRLWAHCGEVHPESGMLTGYSASEIESIVSWWGKPGELVEALVAVGFLDQTEEGYQCHNWLDYQGHLAAFKIRARKGAKARWEKIAGEEIQGLDPSSNAPSNAPSNACGMLQAMPLLTNERTNERTGGRTSGLTGEATAAAAASPQVLVPERANLERHLRAQWGEREGMQDWKELKRFDALGAKYGWEAVFCAIAVGAKHNEKTLDFVRALLEPKEL